MLKGNKISLRALEPEDVDVLYKWENDSALWTHGSLSEPISKQTLEKYISSSHEGLHALKQLRLMIITKDNFESIGCIDLYEFDPRNLRAGIGILIGDKDQRNKGYAGDALEVFLDYCFNKLNIHHLFCTISVDNESSIRLFKSKGFTEVGKRKDWIKVDSGWMDALDFQLVNS